MMTNSHLVSTNIIEIEKESFVASLYTIKHFRMIGLINVHIQFEYGPQKVTLAFYSSSGTNNGKIKDLWYPIVGIKLQTGPFTEFSPYINALLHKITADGMAYKGWLAKSPFFYEKALIQKEFNGFSSGKYYEDLLQLGLMLQDLYAHDNFHNMTFLQPRMLNHLLYSSSTYVGNTHSQAANFDNLIRGIFIKSL